MTHAFTCTLQRPHETLGLPLSVGRRLSRFRYPAWFSVMMGFVLVCLGLYIYQINAAAAQGFALRNLEKQLDHLRVTVTDLENQSAKLQTLQHLQARMAEAGYVAVDRVEYVEAAKEGYALAR
jgi:hypothetical protein